MAIRFGTASILAGVRRCGQSGGANECDSQSEAAKTVIGDSIRPLCLWQGAIGDRLSGILGMARPLQADPACAWCCLCDLRGRLEKPLSYHPRPSAHCSIRRQGTAYHAQLLRDMRDAPALRAVAFAWNGERPSRIVRDTHRAGAALSHRPRRVSGVGLPGRATRGIERFSRGALGSAAKDQTHGGRPTGLGRLMGEQGGMGLPLCRNPRRLARHHAAHAVAVAADRLGGAAVRQYRPDRTYDPETRHQTFAATVANRESAGLPPAPQRPLKGDGGSGSRGGNR